MICVYACSYFPSLFCFEKGVIFLSSDTPKFKEVCFFDVLFYRSRLFFSSRKFSVILLKFFHFASSSLKVMNVDIPVTDLSIFNVD